MLSSMKIFNSSVSGKLKFNYGLRLWRNLSEKKQAMKFDLSAGSKPAPPSTKPLPPRNIRFYSFWSTPAGQKTAGVLMVSASALAAFYQVAPHSFFLNFVHDYYQHLTAGFPTQVSPEMSYLIDEVISDLKMPKEDADNIKFFVMSVMDSAGWGEWGREGLVGYPYYFHFKEKVEVPLSRMQFGNRGSEYTKYLTPEELQSHQAMQLLDGLVLSKEAKKFAIARELLKLQAAPQYRTAALHSSSILLTLLLSRIANVKLNLFRKPPIFRGLNYLIITTITSLLYFTLKDSNNRRVQGRTDERVAALSSSYARGGVEYYSKILQRHIAQRDLCLGGTELYNLHGEEVYEYIRRRNKPFKERRQICLEALQSFGEEQMEPEPDTAAA